MAVPERTIDAEYGLLAQVLGETGAARLNQPRMWAQVAERLRLSGVTISATGEVALADSTINVKAAPFRAVGDGVTDDTNALQAAITAGAGKTVVLPAGIYRHTGLTVGLATRIVGAHRRYTTLRYAGSGVGITLSSADGHYFLSDFNVQNVGTGTVGILMNGTFVTLDNLEIYPTVPWSTAALQSRTDATSFTHLVRNCYIGGNVIGWDVPRGNNMVVDHSWFDGNTTNLRIGNVATVANFVMRDSVAQIASPQGATAKSVHVIRAANWVLAGNYLEHNNDENAGVTGQLSVYVEGTQDVRGVVIRDNYIHGGTFSTNAISFDGTASNIVGAVVEHNTFVRVNGAAVIGDATQLEIGPNWISSVDSNVIYEDVAAGERLWPSNKALRTQNAANTATLSTVKVNANDTPLFGRPVVAIADSAEVVIGVNLIGFLLVAANNEIATLILQGTSGPVLVTDASTVFSITAATASKVNVYRDGGTGEYRIQNKRGTSRNTSWALVGGL